MTDIELAHLVTVPTFALLVGFDEKTVHTRIAAGKLPFTEIDGMKFLDSRLAAGFEALPAGRPRKVRREG